MVMCLRPYWRNLSAQIFLPPAFRTRYPTARLYPPLLPAPTSRLIVMCKAFRQLHGSRNFYRNCDPHRVCRLLAIGAALFCGPLRISAAAPQGSTIYQTRCAGCHGSRGEGVPDKYAQALAGDKQIEELTQLIEE